MWLFVLNSCRASCRPCGWCTLTCLRTRTSWSWFLVILSSCLRWIRAAPVRAGCTGPRWPLGCLACCLRTTSAWPMSRTPGSSTGERSTRSYFFFSYFKQTHMQGKGFLQTHWTEKFQIFIVIRAERKCLKPNLVNVSSFCLKPAFVHICW